MATRTFRRLYKGYGSSSALNTFGFIFSGSTFLFEDLHKLCKSLLLFGNPTFILDVFFVSLFITKYIKENLQNIFKMVLEV